ncbi:MAG: hypothetical protein JWR70_2362 [Modestobacter sp.]|jgi:hypothetical protein|nr:hypothetical protein [Modestobacter sp.]
MPELSFTVVDIAPEPYAAAPTLLARLRVEETTGTRVHALALRAQVRIEPQRRRYDDTEEQALLDLFGNRARYAQTLKPFSWLHAATVAQGFTGSTEFDLTLPCTYDFEVSGTTYLHALRDGEVPLLFLFSGTVFTRGTTGFSVSPVPWDAEAPFRLPVSVWRGLMDQHFPHSEWVRLQRDTVDAMANYRHRRGLTSWDAVVATLLAEAMDPAGERP